MAKLNFFITPVSRFTRSFRNHSNILMCSKTFYIIINIENICAAYYLVERNWDAFRIIWWI